MYLGKRLDPDNISGYDIVRPQWEHWDKRKEMVAGSSPAPGVRILQQKTQEYFLGFCIKEKPTL